jgi:protoheme IX farnesyltransferase
MINRNHIKTFFDLIKVTVTLPVTFLAFIGYILQNEKIDNQLYIICPGVFLLAGAASALNQVIEYKYDSIMERTKKRPIPSGRISKQTAVIIAIILSIIGTSLLYTISANSVILGIINLFWYIGVYTLLKRLTAFAVIPGSLTGAIPLLIGWVAAGGYVFEPKIIYVAALVFMWQIPHFWILMIIYGKEYEEAGFPTLYKIFKPIQIRLWTLLWILAANMVSIGLFMFGIFKSNHQYYMLFLNGIIFTTSFIILCIYPNNKCIKGLFHLINIFMLLTLIILAL